MIYKDSDEDVMSAHGSHIFLECGSFGHTLLDYCVAKSV